MVDFGMDLAAAIIMFEKPMGIWAILEEESLFPKATDKSFEEKLKASLGKLPVFLKPASKTDKNAHFGVSHYAGVVNYNVTSWLEKNKDPVNETVVELFKSTSKCQLLVHLWSDHPGQPTTAPKDDGKKKKKGGGGKTVSSVYLVSLGELMTTLYSCEPHFVRCLVPNNHKKPGDVEPPSESPAPRKRIVRFQGLDSPGNSPIPRPWIKTGDVAANVKGWSEKVIEQEHQQSRMSPTPCRSALKNFTSQRRAMSESRSFSTKSVTTTTMSSYEIEGDTPPLPPPPSAAALSNLGGSISSLMGYETPGDEGTTDL